MDFKKRIAKLFSSKNTTKESMQFFKPGDHVSYQINSPDAIGNKINKKIIDTKLLQFQFQQH